MYEIGPQSRLVGTEETWSSHDYAEVEPVEPIPTVSVANMWVVKIVAGHGSL